MRLLYTTANNGDGSSSVEFFYDQESIDLLEQADPETYAGGEGGSWFDVDGPVTGTEIHTLENVKKAIANGDGYVDLSDIGDY